VQHHTGPAAYTSMKGRTNGFGLRVLPSCDRL
jgi:hypothetical protein